MPLGFVQSTLGDHGPGCAATAALGHVGRERRNAGRSARERVDMLIRRDALRRIDGQRMAESDQQPAGLTVREPAPFDLGHAAVLGPEPDSIGVVSDHLNDIAVVADLLLAAIDRAPCTPEQAEPIAGGDGEIVGLATLIDRAIDDLVVGDLASRLEALADGSADVGAILVRRRTHGDAPL